MRIALRFRRIPRTIAVLAAALAVAAWTGTASAQSADVAACVRDNLVKYAAPDRAVVDQYLSIEAACEAYINGDPSAQISVTPIDGAGGGTSGSSGSSSGGSASGGTTTSPSGAATSGAGGSGSGGGTTTPGAEAQGTAKGGGDAAALAAAGKIAPADAGSPGAVSAITDAPIWLILLLVLVVAGVATGVVMGARRHTK